MISLRHNLYPFYHSCMCVLKTSNLSKLVTSKIYESISKNCGKNSSLDKKKKVLEVCVVISFGLAFNFVSTLKGLKELQT